MRTGTVVKLAGVAVLAIAAMGVTGAGLCKYKLECHLRPPESLDEYAEHGQGRTALPAGFRQRVVASGFSFPTDFAFLPDGSALIAEKEGIVKIAARSGGPARTVLDLRDRVDSSGFRGLVSVDVDPEFERNHFVYLMYVRQEPDEEEGKPTTVRVSRFGFSGRSIARSSEQVLLGRVSAAPCLRTVRADCLPSDVDHDGGDIAFAEDGTLFVATGDGGGLEKVEATALLAQNIDYLGGKILHVTRDGRGLPGNPFCNGDADANGDVPTVVVDIRLTLGPSDHLPYVADVGWQHAEEISVAPRGANLGWPCYEGRDHTPQYESDRACAKLYGKGAAAVRPPLISLPHPDAASVTGGVFYLGDSYPKQYHGAYFFADWGLSWIRYARPGGSAHARLADVKPFASNAAGPVAFRIGPDGDLYYLSLNTGQLRHVLYVR